MSLTNEQKQKLDVLEVESISEDTLKELIRVFKIVQGRESADEFEYEYDYDLDEEEHVNVSLSTFKETCPLIYSKISTWDGNKIFKAMEGNKFTRLIVNKQAHEDKIKEISENKRISQSKRDKQIADRKQMRSEYESLKKINGRLDSNTCWKIWRITQGDKTYSDLIENMGEDKLNKEIDKVEYLGSDFISKCKEIAYPEEEDDE